MSDNFTQEVQLAYLKGWQEQARLRLGGINALTESIFRNLVLLNGGAIVSLFTILGHDSHLAFSTPAIMRAFEVFAGGLFCTMLGMAGSFFAQNEFYLVEQNHAEQIASSILGNPYDPNDNEKRSKRGMCFRIAAIVLCFGAAGCFGGGSYSALRAVTNPPSQRAIAASSLPVAARPQPAPQLPRFGSSIPEAFLGGWDEMVADKCQGREVRYSFTSTTASNFEIRWDVARVKIIGPTEIDVDVTTKGRDAQQLNQLWQLQLMDNGQTLTFRNGKHWLYRKCPTD